MSTSLSPVEYLQTEKIHFFSFLFPQRSIPKQKGYIFLFPRQSPQAEKYIFFSLSRSPVEIISRAEQCLDWLLLSSSLLDRTLSIINQAISNSLIVGAAYFPAVVFLSKKKTYAL